MQPHPNIHEPPTQNVVNEGQEQVPSIHIDLEHQCWGQLVRSHVNRWPNTSPKRIYESSRSDDLHHKHPTSQTNLKVTYNDIPNAIYESNVVVVLPAENHLVILVVDSPSPTHNKTIDRENPSHGEASTRKEFQEKEVTSTSHTESSMPKPIVSAKDIFPKIAAHSVKFAYRF